MDAIEFDNIISHVLKCHESVRMTGGVCEYFGNYKGAKVKVRITDSEMRHVYMNGWKYYLVNVWVKGERCL